MKTRLPFLSETSVVTAILISLISCSTSLKEITFAGGFEEGYTLRQPTEELIRVPKDSITCALIVDDLLCIFDNHRHHEDTPTVRISEISSPDNYKGLIRYGIETGESAMPFINYAEGKISIYDPLLQKIAVLDVREAYQTPGYEPLFKETEILTQRICPFGDRVVFMNVFAFEGKEPLVLFSDENWTSKKRDNVGAYLNVMSGELFTGNKQTMIGCTREGIPEMVIYDNKANPLVKLTFPHEQQRFQKIDFNDGHFEYLNAADDTTNDCFYAGCGGNNMFSLVYDDEKRNDQVVLIFNWKGDIIDGFRTDGIIERVSFSSDEMFLYAWEKIGEEFFLNKYPVKPGK